MLQLPVIPNTVCCSAGKYVPDSAVAEMKSNYTLPQDSDPYIDKIIWVDLTRDTAQRLVDQWVFLSLNTYVQGTHIDHDKALALMHVISFMSAALFCKFLASFKNSRTTMASLESNTKLNIEK